MSGGTTVKQLYQTVNSTNGWVEQSYDVSALAGQTLYLYFGVHGDGYAGAYAISTWTTSRSRAAPRRDQRRRRAALRARDRVRRARVHGLGRRNAAALRLIRDVRRGVRVPRVLVQGVLQFLIGLALLVLAAAIARPAMPTMRAFSFIETGMIVAALLVEQLVGPDLRGRWRPRVRPQPEAPRTQP